MRVPSIRRRRARLTLVASRMATSPLPPSRGEPLAGQLHVVAADLFAGQTTVRIVGVVKIRVGGGRAQTGAAYIAVIEEAGADALGGESVTNAPGQGGFAARRQPHHSHIEFLHGFSGGRRPG